MKKPPALYSKDHLGKLAHAALWIISIHAFPTIAASPIACPASIAQDSVQLRNMPAGWTTFVAAPLYLHNAVPMSGPPSQLGELADFKQRRLKGAWTYTYELDGRFPEGKWLACSYGESNQVTLASRLDDNVRSCSFTHQDGKFVG